MRKTNLTIYKCLEGSMKEIERDQNYEDGSSIFGRPIYCFLLTLEKEKNNTFISSLLHEDNFMY